MRHNQPHARAQKQTYAKLKHQPGASLVAPGAPPCTPARPDNVTRTPRLYQATVQHKLQLLLATQAIILQAHMLARQSDVQALAKNVTVRLFSIPSIGTANWQLLASLVKAAAAA
jgi:hypothetical protein